MRMYGLGPRQSSHTTGKSVFSHPSSSGSAFWRDAYDGARRSEAGQAHMRAFEGERRDGASGEADAIGEGSGEVGGRDEAGGGDSSARRSDDAAYACGLA